MNARRFESTREAQGLLRKAQPRANVASWVLSKLPKTDRQPTDHTKPDFDL